MSDYRRNLAWKAGQKAARAGKPRSANNHQRGTIFHDDWFDGWCDERATMGLDQDDDEADTALATEPHQHGGKGA